MFLLYMKQLFDLFLVQICTDHADTSCIICSTTAKLCLLRNKIKMEPLSLYRGNNAFGTENFSIFTAFCKLVQNIPQLFFTELVGCLYAPACKHIIGMMVSLMIVMMAAATFPVMVVMIVLLVIVVMATATFSVMVMMIVLLMIVMMAAAALSVVMMLMLLMIVVMAAAALSVVMMLMLFQKFLLQRIHLFHSFKNIPAVDVIPWCCDDGCLIVFLTDHLYTGIQLIVRHLLGTAQDHGTGISDLVIIEPTIILQIYFTF